MAIFTAIVSVISALAGIYGAIYSKQGRDYSKLTADNVERVNFEIQNKLLKDLIRHLFRNQVCTIAFAAKWEKDKTKYPSDEHVLKLKVLADDIHLEKYNNSPEFYDKMHGIGMLLRNYNAEIDIIHTHLKDPYVDDETKKNGIKTLMFKPVFLINRIWGVMAFLNKEKEEAKKKSWFKLSEEERLKREEEALAKAKIENQEIAVDIVLQCHINNLKENYCIDKVDNVWAFEDIIEAYKDNIRLDKINELVLGLTRSEEKDKKIAQMYEALVAGIEANITELEKNQDNASDPQKAQEEIEKRKKAFDALQNRIMFETKSDTLSDIKWNADLVLQMLVTDAIIEYNKIHMIEYRVEQGK
ncbi:hypothetical protein D0T50_12820 [Bacteroides sp. 214]|nr:hypothetical protein [Bacteroides sp. 214]